MLGPEPNSELIVVVPNGTTGDKQGISSKSGGDPPRSYTANSQ